MSEKIYYPEEIQSNSIPEISSPESEIYSYSSKNISTPERLPNNVAFPPKNVSREVLSSTLNTKSKKILGEYSFGEVGSLQIGKYENGVSGDIRITPNGITARDYNGETTFSLDGGDGSAVFRGSIQTGAVIAGFIDLTGRITINDGSNDRIWIGNLTPQSSPSPSVSPSSSQSPSASVSPSSSVSPSPEA